MVNEGAGARFKEIHVSTFNSDARVCLGNNLEIAAVKKDIHNRPG